MCVSRRRVCCTDKVHLTANAQWTVTVSHEYMLRSDSWSNAVLNSEIKFWNRGYLNILVFRITNGGFDPELVSSSHTLEDAELKVRCMCILYCTLLLVLLYSFKYYHNRPFHLGDIFWVVELIYLCAYIAQALLATSTSRKNKKKKKKVHTVLFLSLSMRDTVCSLQYSTTPALGLISNQGYV